jgi:hypothetical protein
MIGSEHRINTGFSTFRVLLESVQSRCAGVRFRTQYSNKFANFAWGVHLLIAGMHASLVRIAPMKDFVK